MRLLLDVYDYWKENYSSLSSKIGDLAYSRISDNLVNCIFIAFDAFRDSLFETPSEDSK